MRSRDDAPIRSRADVTRYFCTFGCMKILKKGTKPLGFAKKEVLLKHYVDVHSLNDGNQLYGPVILQAIQRDGLLPFCYMHGILDSDFVRKYTASEESRNEFLLNFKLLLWHKVESICILLWNKISPLLHGPGFPKQVNDLLVYIPAFDRWNYEIMSTLIREHSPLFLRPIQEMQGKDDTFRQQIQDLQQHIPFEVGSTTNFLKLLEDCHIIGLDLFQVHKTVYEMVSLQSQHMLQVIKSSVPPLHLQLWDTLTSDKLLKPIFEMQQRLTQFENSTKEKLNEMDNKLDLVITVLNKHKAESV